MSRMKQVPAPKLIFEKSRPGRIGCNPPVPDTPEVDLAACVGPLREELPLPEIAELDLLRHFTNLSQINYGIETGFYPLGSCTMKYNPKVNEQAASLSGFTHIHPLQPASSVPGAMEVLLSAQDILVELTGFDEISLQPVAGAHGEMTCLMMIKAYHESRGEGETRKVVLIPDSAHGTNPASAARCDYSVKSVHTADDGLTDLAALKELLDESVAAVMLTNPSTLALFQRNIVEVCEMVHAVGAQVICDGANMNAMVGVTRPGDHGFDCMHLNLHKTFSTPHGGGGPGCGAVGFKAHLAPFQPVPVVTRKDDQPFLDYNRPQTIGRVSPFFGHFLMVVRGLTYLLAFGKEHIADIAKHAVLNANYVQARLKEVLPPAHDRFCMHECVLSAERYKASGIHAIDISKALIDRGFHPPTNMFPLIVPQALMIEPTETESKETLDAFCDAMIEICREAKENPDLLHTAPTTQIVGRLDETAAAKNLDLRWKPPEG